MKQDHCKDIEAEEKETRFRQSHLCPFSPVSRITTNYRKHTYTHIHIHTSLSYKTRHLLSFP